MWSHHFTISLSFGYSDQNSQCMFSRIFNGGLKSGQTPDEQKKIVLLNKMASVFILGVGIKFLNELYVRDFFGITITLSLIGLFLLVILLNHNGKKKLARFIFLFVNTTLLFIINILYGREFGSEFILFPLIMFVLLYLDKSISKILWLFVFAAVYCSSLVYLSNNQPIFVENLDPQSFYFMLLICTVVVFMLTSLFIEENKNFYQKTSLLLDEVSSKNKELEDANTELERFAFIASHDLKTPLRNINSFLKLIERKIEKGNTQDIQEYLDYASLNAKRMHNLVQDILTFSQMNTENVPFQTLDLNKVVNRAINNLQDLVEQKAADIQIEKLPTVVGNQAQLMILFQNLIENGLKYNSSRSPFIQIKAIETDLQYELLIRDNGIGIPEEYSDKVFDMFYRLHSQEDYSGTGIGLATCKKIAVFHGGNISIQHSDQTGTTFKLNIAKVGNEIVFDKKNKRQLDKSFTLQN